MKAKESDNDTDYGMWPCRGTSKSTDNFGCRIGSGKVSSD